MNSNKLVNLKKIDRLKNFVLFLGYTPLMMKNEIIYFFVLQNGINSPRKSKMLR